jgi:hypothetical protein
MKARHEMEKRALVASAAGRGKEPSEEALDRLNGRQTNEIFEADKRQGLAKLSLLRADVRRVNRADQEGFGRLNAAEKALIRDRALERELSIVRETHELRLSGMDRQCPDYSVQVKRQNAEIHGLLLRHEARKLRDLERDLAYTGGQRQTRAQWRATYPQREALMQRRHDNERMALRASAAGYGKEVSPEDVVRLERRHADERARLAAGPTGRGLSRAESLVAGKGKAVARGVAKLPGEALQKIQQAQKKLHKSQSHHRGPDMQSAEALKGSVEQTGHAAVAGIARVATTAAAEAAKAALHQAKHAAEAAKVTAQAIVVGVVNPLAGVKEAGRGYAEVGAKSAQTAGKDLVSGTKNTSRDAASATKDTVQQGLGSLASGGLSAAPQEVQALARTMKEAVATSVRATRQLVQGVVTLNPLQAIGGTATEVAKGGLAIGKEATKMVAAKLPMPVEKTLDLAAKIPVLGLAAKAAKLTAEVSAGGLGKGMDIDR